MRIPTEDKYKFRNDFSVIKAKESIYLAGIDIPEVRAENWEPELWDGSGTLASFSASSEVAAVRDFFRKNARGVRGASGGNSKNMPPRPPAVTNAPDGQLLTLASEIEYRQSLVKVREEAYHYHRWTSGEKGRKQWKKTPTRTGSDVIKIEGDSDGSSLDQQSESALPPTEDAAKMRTVWSKSDLRRYTINCHPALARAMTRVLSERNGKEEVRGFMKAAAQGIADAFEKITGRKVMGISVHFDSNTPHWNLWHCGLERVLYRIRENGKDRTRYRRTAFNLNATGPGLLAWDRVRRSFQRQGKDFQQICKWTQMELEEAEARCMERQGRRPGDWVVNEVADNILEGLMFKAGWDQHVESGFSEFVAHEVMRYETGMAGRGARNLKKLANEKPIQEIHDLAGSLIEFRQKLKKAQQASLELEEELIGLRRIRDLMVQFWDRLRSTRKLARLFVLVGRQARGILRSIGKEIGRNFQDQDRDTPDI
ncbi:hypothetical protein [Haloferula sp.]|uniref:hypothetical protein n=1 Tax=Haloferula sp. TaxID=2497595 RepID=UPI003C70C07D